jgi:hypothetical protein
LFSTVVIRDKTIRVDRGLIGRPDLLVRADSNTWLGFVAKERNLPWELIRRKIILKGRPNFLVKFGRSFPS